MNAAVSGCGFAGQKHIRAWKEIGGAKLVAVHDINEVIAKQISEKRGIEYYTDFREMLGKEDLQIVSICTPPQSHIPLAIQAITAGVNVLIEKPLSTNSVEARKKLLPILRKTPIRAAVVNNILFSHVIRKARVDLKKGLIGELLAVDIHWHISSYPPLNSRSHWIHKLPAGILQEPLSHPIYILQDILGDDLSVEEVLISKMGDRGWVPYDELRVTFTSSKRTAHLYMSCNAGGRTAVFISIYGTDGTIATELTSKIYRIIKPINIHSHWGVFSDAFNQSWQTIKSPVKYGVMRALKRERGTHEENIRNFINQIEGKNIEVESKMDSQIKALEIEEEVVTRILKSLKLSRS